MPGVNEISAKDKYPDLDALSLESVLRTHILSEDNNYLLPIACLLLDENDGYQPLVNPYFDFSRSKTNTNPDVANIKKSELVRLERHSQLTSSLVDNLREYNSVIYDKSTLLNRLHMLRASLKKHDAHGGIGTQGDAAGGAYPAIIQFMEYYRLLENCGIHTINHTPPKLEDLPEARKIGYFIASDESDPTQQSLYFINSYTAEVTLLKKSTDPLSTPVLMLHVDKLPINIPDTFTKDYPIIIYVEETKQYFAYGDKQNDWELTLLDKTKLEKFNTLFTKIQKNHMVSLPTESVPQEFKESLKDAMAHQSRTNSESFFSSLAATDFITQEQQLAIYGQTGHDKITAKTSVPERTHQSIMRIWDFIQDITSNVSAVTNIATCIGSLGENLQQNITQSRDQELLGAISLGGEAKSHIIAESKQSLESINENLKAAIEDGSYKGQDELSITNELLDTLGIDFTLKSREELSVLQAMRPEDIDRLLLNNQTRQDNLLMHFNTVEDLVLFIMDTPVELIHSILLPIVSRFRIYDHHNPGNSGININEFLMPLNTEKRIAVCEVFMSTIKRSRLFKLSSRGDNNKIQQIFSSLSEDEKTILLEKTKDKLPNFISSNYDLKTFLSYLSSENKDFVLNAIKDKLPEIFNLVGDFYEFNGLIANHSVLKEIFEQVLQNLFNKIRNDFYVSLLNKRVFTLGLTIAIAESPELMASIYKIFKSKLDKFIDQSNFFDMLNSLPAEEGRELKDLFKHKYPGWIKSLDAVNILLKKLPTDERSILLDTLKFKLPEIYKTFDSSNATIENLNKFLILLPPEQGKVIGEAVKSYITSSKVSGIRPARLSQVLKMLPLNKRMIVYKELKDDVSKFMRDIIDFNIFFIDDKSEEERKSICKIWKDQLFPLMKTIDKDVPHYNEILQVLKNETIETLQAYIEKIKVTDGSIKVTMYDALGNGFRYGLFSTKHSIAIDQAVNYRLAEKLISELKEKTSYDEIETVFNHVAKLREEVIEEYQFTENGFIDYGIDRELLAIMSKVAPGK